LGEFLYVYVWNYLLFAGVFPVREQAPELQQLHAHGKGDRL